MVVNLSVHRNTLDKRRRRETLADLQSCVRRERRHSDMIGYALVTWDRELRARINWIADKTMPAVMIPDFVRRQILREIGIYDAEEAVRNMFDAPDDSA